MAFTASAISLIRAWFQKTNSVPQPSNILPTMGQAAFPFYGGAALSGGGGVGPATSTDELLPNSMAINMDLLSKYADYLDMSQYPECFTALNILADEATQNHPLKNHSVWVETEDENLKVILENLLYKQLNIEQQLWSLARVTAKYGNSYREIIVKEGQGVVKILGKRTTWIRRLEDAAGDLYGFIEDRTLQFKIDTHEFLKRINDTEDDVNKKNDGLKLYEPWETVHFRLQGDEGDDLYGLSILDGARYAWKRLQMMDDSLVLFKLTRSQQRYVFYVDVGDIPPNEARKELNKVKQEFKKQQIVDQNGKITYKFNPLSTMDDFFIAKRKEKRSTEIDVLTGLDGGQQVDDVQYFKDKLISGLGVPKSYLGYDESVGRANLGIQDTRFAKSVLRIQSALKSGIKQICDVHLAARNIDPSELDFTIAMTPPSGTLEIAHIESQKAKCDLASQYQGLNIPDEYIWKNILGLTDEEIAIIQGQPSGEATASNPEQPANETPGPEAPPAETPKPEQQTASKYRKIEKSKQLSENIQMQLLRDISISHNNLSNKIQGVRGIVQEIKNSIRKR